MWSLCKTGHDYNPAERTQNDCECWPTTLSDATLIQFITVFRQLVNTRLCTRRVNRRLTLDATTDQRVPCSCQRIDFDADPCRWFRRGDVRPDPGVYKLWLGRSARHCRRPLREKCSSRGRQYLDSRRDSALFHRIFGSGGLLCGKPKARLPATPLRCLRHVFWHRTVPRNESNRAATQWIARSWPVPTSRPRPRSPGTYDLHRRTDRILPV